MVKVKNVMSFEGYSHKNKNGIERVGVGVQKQSTVYNTYQAWNWLSQGTLLAGGMREDMG